MANHYRQFEGLSIAQIAERLGRSPATIKAYFYDPTGEKARAVNSRYQGVCRGCGAYTQPRNGKGDAYAYCKACHPGAIERRWTRERVLEAMRVWRELPTVDCRRRMTVAHTRPNAAEATRPRGWRKGNGPPRRSLLTFSATGRRREQLHCEAAEPGVRVQGCDGGLEKARRNPSDRDRVDCVEIETRNEQARWPRMAGCGALHAVLCSI